MPRQNGFPPGKKNRPFHEILKFTHIARPVIVKQPAGCLGRKFGGRKGILPHIHVHKKTGQFQYVLSSLPERGKTQGNDIEAKEKILTKLSFPDPFFQIAVCRGDDADIDPPGALSAHAGDLAVLQQPQQLGVLFFRQQAGDVFVGLVEGKHGIFVELAALFGEHQLLEAGVLRDALTGDVALALHEL